MAGHNQHPPYPFWYYISDFTWLISYLLAGIFAFKSNISFRKTFSLLVLFLCLLRVSGGGVLDIFGLPVLILLLINSIRGLIKAGVNKKQPFENDLQGQKRKISEPAMLITVSVIILLIGLQLPMFVRPQLPFQMICGSNLSGLGKSMLIYAEEHGEYPAVDKWCDFMLEKGLVTEEKLKCPVHKNKRGSYAMNPNCKVDSEDDVVLLFESKGGWNLFGGAELLASENHGGNGLNILFKNGAVQFVKVEEFGELNWGDGGKDVE
ncbi:MAG TPA: hypothetical protein ENH82_08155 [bacterium]|nr:hypothetical protein [bacterium]